MAYSFRISGDIGKGAFDFSKEDLIFHLEEAKGDDLIIDLDSEGGYVHEGFAIYAQLKRYEKKNYAEITTRTDGMVASIATIIFLAGTKRIVNEFMQPFIHNPIYDDGRDLDESISKTSDLISKFYSKHTNLSKKKASKLMDVNTWMTANECLEYGFATEIEKLSNASYKIVAKRKNNLKNKNEMKNYGDKAKMLAQSILGIKPKNKIVLDTNQDELDFFELEDDENIKVGDKANSGGSPADGEYTIVSPEDDDLTWKLVFEDGELKDIVKKEEVEEESDDSEAKIKELESEISEIKKAKNKLSETLSSKDKKIKKYEDTLNKIAKLEPQQPTGASKRNDSQPKKVKVKNRALNGLNELKTKN